MIKLTTNQKNAIRETINFILVFLLLVSSIWFIKTFKMLYREGDLRVMHGQYPSHLNQNENTNINNIKTWMTFDYLNIVFKLDPSYFQKVLNINDPRYPNIRIDRYAKNHKLNPYLLLNNIQQSIISYSYTAH